MRAGCNLAAKCGGLLMFLRFHRLRFRRITAVLCAILMAAHAHAEQDEDNSRAILLDAFTGNVLYAKAPDAAFPPGNIAKLMTMAILFDAISTSKISGQTPYTVSEYAWRTGGAPSRRTTMFARIGETIPVMDLLRGAATVQGNDACIILAEGFSGSEPNFVQVMNARADEIGLQDTRFSNATGLPSPGQMTTVRDAAKLARHIIDQYGDLYPLFREEAINWSNIYQRNKNPYLGNIEGVDGMTTGFLEETGHMAVATAQREERRFIAVVAGMESAAARDRMVRELLELGFTGFIERELFLPGQTVAEVRVHGGAQSYVALTALEPVRIALPRDGPGAVVARVIYDGPLIAPLAKGQVVARLQLSRDGQIQRELPLVTVSAVASGGLMARARDGALELAREAVFGTARTLFSGGS